jgi:hypothetical protein
MTDAPKPPETSLQRAVRLKNEAIAARPKPPRGKVLREPSGGAMPGKSKPWMSR